LRQSGARKEDRHLVTPVMALVSAKIGVFWEVALLFGRLVDIDVSEESPSSMMCIEGALSEQKKKRNLVVPNIACKWG
jgi:hypothetical protein